MRVLVVDDEMYTREGILDYVDWEKFGVDEVMDAEDGLVALGIADWFCPDVVISDVKMPQMDGITFAQKFLERFPDSKIIFISAYLEIKYYQQAIRLSAVDYVEKPLDMEELEEALRKAIKGIHENTRKREDQKKSRFVLKEQAVNYLINPRKNMPRCMELCDQMEFPKEAQYICLCFKDLEKEDIHATVELIDGFFENLRLSSMTAKNDDHMYCCILAMNGVTKNHYPIKDLGRQFVNQYPSFQIGIGFYVDHLNVICESWRLARDVIDHAFYEPQETVFEMVQFNEAARSVDSGIYTRINQVITNDFGRLPVILNTVFSEFEQRKTLSPDSIRAFAKAIVIDMLRQGGIRTAVLEDVFYGQSPEDYIDDCGSLEEIHNILNAVAVRIGGKEERAGESPIMKQAYRYIRSNYQKQGLGLAEIAEQCGISIGHLSSIFKKEARMTARQYIEEYRIEVAKEKLRSTNERVQDISGECGFAQHGYFSRVFKQQTGMTPAEYREKYYE